MILGLDAFSIRAFITASWFSPRDISPNGSSFLERENAKAAAPLK